MTELDEDEILTPAMIRAARGLLGLDQAGAAELAGLSQRTISKLEAENDLFSKDLRRRNALQAIRSGFEKAGIEFIFPSEESGQGVRMRRTSK
ncbi:helix-turn-helix domain-containing protein [Bradyrhizobium sp. 131]|uniref:helix-turn-helix domain-containing protein n=1 Tax=Bradyrhizobium sp. 131 TaxID=2782609 RepID=UPI001FFE878C|nr:helix-turn-helix domain-containing protein [Bradyrhizobium sp. 131]UPK19137.1 helix-turn-helix domain-containing protein [Bradyrhizobium sp. 131]